MDEFSDVFTCLGELPEEYHIDVDKNVKPVEHATHRVPLPLQEKLNEKIEEMVKEGIITKVEKPIDWINSLVAIQRGEKLRICIDPRDLNKAMKMPKYQLSTVEEMLTYLSR